MAHHGKPKKRKKEKYDVWAVTTYNLDPKIKDELHVKQNIRDIYNPLGNIRKHKLILTTKRWAPKWSFLLIIFTKMLGIPQVLEPPIIQLFQNISPTFHNSDNHILSFLICCQGNKTVQNLS